MQKIQPSTVGKILCCLCGNPIDPNAAAMCISCLQSQYKITDDIDKNIDLIQCKKCERWNYRLDHWINHELESAGLLTMCLKKINGLTNKDIKVVDAAWIWTEHHSRRLKMSIDIERGVLDGKITLRQRFIVDFIVHMKQCADCARQETDHTWGAMVQIRQNLGHKRSLYHVETLLVNAGLDKTIIDVESKKEGLDLYFRNKSQAEKVAEYISANLLCKSKTSKKLVSHNTQNHTAKQELTICLDIATLLKDDLILTSREMTGSIDLMLVVKVSSSIHLFNPFTLSKYEMNALKYFSLLPKPLLTSRQLEKFVVLDIEKIDDKLKGGKDLESNIWSLAEAEVVKESDFGENDRTYRIITHLGNILQIGDYVLGYDLGHSVSTEESLEILPYACPDIILVRKTYPEKTPKGGKKANKSGRNRRKQGKSMKSEEIHEDTMEGFTESHLVEEVIVEDEEGEGVVEDEGIMSWLDLNDIEYEIYQQQLADEVAFDAEIEVYDHHNTLAEERSDDYATNDSIHVDSVEDS